MAAYLITQATGQQSQWVIKNLLEADVTIHAIVRNLDRIPALLDSRNIVLFYGENNNFDDVFKAAQGCKAVFLHTFSFSGLEATRAKMVIEACEKVGVMSIVASTSIFTAKQHFWRTEFIKSTVPELNQYQLSKYEVEGIVRASGLQSYSIFRPVMLHFEFYLPPVHEKLPRLLTCRELDDLLTDDAKLPFIDVNDLGKYVGAALLDRSRFGGGGGRRFIQQVNYSTWRKLKGSRKEPVVERPN